MCRYRVGDAPGGGGEIIFLQSKQYHNLFLTAHTDQEKVDARVSTLYTLLLAFPVEVWGTRLSAKKAQQNSW